jgi:hypothetical protein
MSGMVAASFCSASFVCFQRNCGDDSVSVHLEMPKLALMQRFVLRVYFNTNHGEGVKRIIFNGRGGVE